MKALLRLVVAAIAGAALVGCVSPREIALQQRQPQKQHYERTELLARPADVPGAGSEDTVLVELAATPGQNVCLLNLAPGAALGRRYHRKTDLTLVGVTGSAIVRVEETRYVLRPGAVIVLKRMTAYAVMAVEDGDEFAALAIFSPPYDPGDVKLLKD